MTKEEQDRYNAQSFSPINNRDALQNYIPTSMEVLRDQVRWQNIAYQAPQEPKMNELKSDPKSNWFIRLLKCYGCL